MKNQFLIYFQELRVYQAAFENAMQAFEAAKTFPHHEQPALAAALIQSARQVCIHIAQAWQRRRHIAAFVAGLNRAEAEVASTQVWLEFAVLCSYLDAETGQELHHRYQEVLLGLAHLIENATVWVISTTHA